MNNQGKNLFERALNTKLQFGNRRSPNVIVLENAVIIKRNFSGKDIQCKGKNGKPFVKKGRRFTLVLTEELFKALVEQKGECSYGIWAFGGEEDPDLKLWTVEVNVKMESANPPVCTLYTKKDGKADLNVLDSTNLNVLDEIYDCDIERIDLVLSPYDPDQTGHFTLWLRDLKISQNEIEDSDEYWENIMANDNDIPFNIDPNQD